MMADRLLESFYATLLFFLQHLDCTLGVYDVVTNLVKILVLPLNTIQFFYLIIHDFGLFKCLILMSNDLSHLIVARHRLHLHFILLLS